MSRRMPNPFRKVLVILLALVLLGALRGWAQVTVRETGAKGDGVTDDTKAVQQAIDDAARNGSAVVFPPGTYLCGQLFLRSGSTLRLESGATVLGARKRSAYPERETLPFPNEADHETALFKPALFFAEDAERVVIEGSGAIRMDFEKRGGPKPIALRRCRFVTVRDVTILNAPNYAISMLGCEEVNITGVTILNAFADGIDPDACSNVRITNCRVESVDDAIVPKSSFSLGYRRPSENIVISDCILSTVCNGIKLGTESGGGFRNIAVSNCVITGFRNRRPAISGIAIESVDGGEVQNITVQNIVMRDVRAPVFIRLGNRGRDMAEPVPGAVRDVVISGITAVNASLAASVTGIPGHPVRGITLRDMRWEFYGGNPWQPWETVPEKENAYPEALMFGGLPAYALYCRHVEDLILENVTVQWKQDFWRLTTDVYRDITWPEDGSMPSHAQPASPGTAFHFEAVSGLVCRGFQAQPDPDPSVPVCRCVNLKAAQFDPAPAIKAVEGIRLFHFSGERTADILLRGIPPEKMPSLCLMDETVPKQAVRAAL